MTVGIVLAAGAGRRFGGPKAAAVLDGERLVYRAARCLHEGGCSPVLVVLGAWVEEVPGAEVVLNDDWPTGMASSLRAGLDAAEHTDADAALVTLVDLPGLTTAAVRRMVEAGMDRTQAAAATYNGTRGHPVVLGRDHWRAVAESSVGDTGARVYLDALGDRLLLVEVGDVASGEDLDYPA